MLLTAYLEMFHGSIRLNCYLHGCKNGVTLTGEKTPACHSAWSKNIPRTICIAEPLQLKCCFLKTIHFIQTGGRQKDILGQILLLVDLGEFFYAADSLS